MRKFFVIFCCFIFVSCDDSWNQFASEFKTEFTKEYIIPETEKCIKKYRDLYSEHHRKSKDLTSDFNKEDDFKEKAELAFKKAEHLAMAESNCFAAVDCMNLGSVIDPVYKIMAEQEKLLCDIYSGLADQFAMTAGQFDNAEQIQNATQDYIE